MIQYCKEIEEVEIREIKKNDVITFLQLASAFLEFRFKDVSSKVQTNESTLVKEDEDEARLRFEIGDVVFLSREKGIWTQGPYNNNPTLDERKFIETLTKLLSNKYFLNLYILKI